MSHSNSKITKGGAHFVKNAWAEPFAKKIGTRLGKFLLGYPVIVNLLNSAGPEGKKFASTTIRGGGGVIQLPGSGPVAYILNEAFDAFAGGLGDAVEEFEKMSVEELANHPSVNSALDKAVIRFEEVLNSEVIIKDKWFHMSGCPEARGGKSGKKMTMRVASEYGYLPMNCRCFGRVFNVPDEEETTESVNPLTVIELMDEIEREAVETKNEVLLGQITHFNESFFSLSSNLQLKFEYLAKEKRSMQKLKLLIRQPEENWEATIDAMLDAPTKAKAEGILKKLVGGLGKIGDKIIEKFDAEGVESENLLEQIGSGMRRRSNELDIRYAEKLKEYHSKEQFRKDQASKRGWFTYTTYFSVFFLINYIVYYFITH